MTVIKWQSLNWNLHLFDSPNFLPPLNNNNSFQQDFINAFSTILERK